MRAGLERHLGAAAATLVTVLALLPDGLDARGFTSKKTGKTIEAEIVSATGDKVVIRREDGKQFTVPVKTLSEDDQKFIAQWKEDNPNVNFRYRFDKKRLEKVGNGSNAAERWAYEIEIHNQGLEDVEGLEIKYTLFRTLRDRYARGKKNTTSEAAEGSAKIALIKRGNSGSATSKAITIQKRNSVSRSYSGRTITETYTKWNESLSGIRLSVYKDGKLLDTTEFGSTVPDGRNLSPSSGSRSFFNPPR